MASIAFRMVGSSLGGMIGGPIGGMIGSTLGASLGGMVDRSLFGKRGSKLVEGPRLTNTIGISAEEGAPIPRIYGRVRLGGQVIWATEFEEERRLERTGSSGGKSIGVGGSSSAAKTTTTEVAHYYYYANVAIALCEGPVTFIRRMWADGEELDLTALNFRLHTGGAEQMPDPLIVAKQGRGDLPAYRGVAYVVFERFALAKYGNRLPQFSFELVRAPSNLNFGIRALNLIPGSNEFGYTWRQVREEFGYGSSQAVNRAQWVKTSDWTASIDDMRALIPHLEHVTLISAWFGDDLRVGACSLTPRVEKYGKVTSGLSWQVSGLARENAPAVSTSNGRPAYGGTPSDQSVIDALRDLKARGLRTALHPFILMDIPAPNGRQNPYSAGEQPTYPWRGRITSMPAPSQPGAPQGADLRQQIAAFLGGARAEHFYQNGDEIHYVGPAEWSFRRMVLHHAMLARAAGGVNTFFIGSEMVGLTHLNAGDGTYPFVEGLRDLLAEVRTILGAGTLITYAADWTEYGSHVRGSEVRFPLDSLWAHPEIGAVSIDYYPPLTDWRAGVHHADAQAGFEGAADPAYIEASLTGGEGFDWYYANAADREAQNRTPITDGAYGKPWIYRSKDLVSWWKNSHIERVNGVELGASTAWVAQSKPIFLSEIGCPAVDKGGNLPSAFPDPKSIESTLPYFSHGGRDDGLQFRVLMGIINHFTPSSQGFKEENNPVSPLYNGRMLAPDFIVPWAYDARPFPAFPYQTSLWSDGANWVSGHWLNGRLEAMPLDELVGMILSDFGVEPALFHQVDGMVDGYIIERPMNTRAALEPIMNFFGLTARMEGQRIAFLGRPRNLKARFTRGDLVPTKDGLRVEIIRMEESELPRVVRLGYVESAADFRQAIASAELDVSPSRREMVDVTTLHLPRSEAERLASTYLSATRLARETFHFRLPMSQIALEVGDYIEIESEAGQHHIRLSRIADGAYRECEAQVYDPVLADPPPGGGTLAAAPITPALPGVPFVKIIELPLVYGTGGDINLLTAYGRAEPWRGPYTIYQEVGGSLSNIAALEAPARLGVTRTDFPAGALWRMDQHSTLDITLYSGALASLSLESVLAGGNALALIAPSGESEIILCQQAELIGEDNYRLSRFIRGVGGSEAAAKRSLASGAEVVVLDASLVSLEGGKERLGLQQNYIVTAQGRDAADASSLRLSALPDGRALRPLAPVHPRANRQAAGVAFSFIRRVRNGGDNWDLYEIPLGETREEYVFELWQNDTRLRQVSLTTPAWFLSNAEEINLFGAQQSNFKIRIAQMSAEMGLGAFWEGELTLS